jgi:TctA family transporter
MHHPKVVSASAIGNYTLLVEFDNFEKKKYDVTPLLNKEVFSPLKNADLFKAVKVEQGGYAVFWNSKIDISEYELWNHGQAIP